MTMLLLGAGGMLGHAVRAVGSARGEEVAAYARGEVDVRNVGQLEDAFERSRPRWVINAAAMTDVDGCEARVEAAMAVNGEAVATIAALCDRHQALLVQVSTDYVFDGAATVPYSESAETNPRSVYGRSKLRGEVLALQAQASIVVRTSWLFGPDGRNFVATIQGLAKRREPLRIVDDQVGCPTYTPYLASALFDLAEEWSARGSMPSILHYRNGPPVSWCGFGKQIVEVFDVPTRIDPVSTDEFPRPAPRPPYSVLSVDQFERLTGRSVELWRHGLEEHADACQREIQA